MIKTKKTGKKKKRIINPQKKAQMQQKFSVRALFYRIGFSRVASDEITFTFEERTGEIDDIFIQENILLLTEYTVGKYDSGHVAKKSILYEKILNNPSGWVKFYKDVNDSFSQKISSSNFQSNEFKIHIIYVSTEGVSEEIEKAFPDYRFFDGNRYRYFDALSRTIHNSSRHEFHKYLALDYSEIGERIHDSSKRILNFDGHVLPENHSGYTTGFKVVSFYADPASLLAISYVLRKDSWRDEEGLYQRILIKSKISNMRKYLVDIKRVFVNNIIVTLPNNTKLLDADQNTINPKDIQKVQQVSIGVPYSANMIGLIDGQHRVFCYYESDDLIEPQIAKLRTRQNLLVTGLIFPPDWSDTQKRQFEANLFLEINDNQARAKSGLKQSIELILSPYTSISIAKEITNRLTRKGPLEGLLQTNFFDPPEKIKTTSIVSYGLKPLIKLDGKDSFYFLWEDKEKDLLQSSETNGELRKVLLERYISFCVEIVIEFLKAARLNTANQDWKLADKKRSQFLTPTTINGFFVCIRRLIENNKLTKPYKFDTKLAGLENFTFSNYTSSGWTALGNALYKEYFESESK